MKYTELNSKFLHNKNIFFYRRIGIPFRKNLSKKIKYFCNNIHIINNWIFLGKASDFHILYNYIIINLKTNEYIFIGDHDEFLYYSSLNTLKKFTNDFPDFY